MKNSVFSLPTVLLIALSMFVALANSNAQTFKIDGPKTYTFTSQTSRTIKLQNLTPSNQKVYINVENNPNFELEYTANMLDLLDSSHTPGGEFVIYFDPRGRNITNAQIIFFDSVATRDTIFVNGRDELFYDTTRPYRLYDTLYKELTGGVSPSKYIHFLHGAKGWHYLLRIFNYSTKSATFNLSFVGAANGFSIVPASITLGTYPGQGMTNNLTMNYTSTGNKYDTAMLVVASSFATIPNDTLVFIGFDTEYAPKPVIRGDTIDFGIRAPGKPATINVEIKNPLNEMIAVSSVITDTNPSTNFTIQHHSDVIYIQASAATSLIINFNPPNQYDTYSQLTFEFRLRRLAGFPDFDSIKYVLIGRTKRCFPLDPPTPLALEATIAGGYTDAFFTITNNEAFPIRIPAVNIATETFPGNFSIPASFPMTVPSHSSGKIPVRFAPKEMLTDRDKCKLIVLIDSTGDDNLCRALDYEVSCNTLSTIDDYSIRLYPDQTTSLPMASKADTLSRRFEFWNNLDVPVKVVSVSATSGGHFKVIATNPSPLPTTIQSSGLFTVDVLFDATNNGYYVDTLTIVTEHSVIPQKFILKATRTEGLPSSVKAVSKSEPFLTIAPNPATNSVVTCTASTGTKKITIFDALGNLVAQKERSAEWTWTTVNTTGTPVPSGVYFIRAEGETDNGRPFVVSKKLIIDR